MYRKVPGNEGAVASSTNILVAWARRALSPTNLSSDFHLYGGLPLALKPGWI